MKPSWDDAPEWAQWLAMDEGGCWYWHAGQPFWDAADGCWYDRDIENEMTALAAQHDVTGIDPSSTLEGRH